MSDFFVFIKIVAICQFFLIIFLLLYAYILKIYEYYKNIRVQRITYSIEQMIQHALGTPLKDCVQNFMPYQQHLDIFMSCIQKMDEVTQDSTTWPPLRALILSDVMLPLAHQYLLSRQWDKRALACLIFQLSLSAINEKILLKLLQDPIPLVSINAAILVMQHPSQTLINTVIDVFATGRHVQQSLYADIMSPTPPAIAPLIIHRLTQDSDPYIRAFCYRTLAHLTCKTDLSALMYRDLASTHLDLKIAALDCLTHHPTHDMHPLIVSLLNDAAWEVRAYAAKMVGQLRDESLAVVLEKSLHDPQWWVRMNAAEALGKLGAQGACILKQQQNDHDPFAYEVAQLILLRGQP